MLDRRFCLDLDITDRYIITSLIPQILWWHNASRWIYHFCSVESSFGGHSFARDPDTHKHSCSLLPCVLDSGGWDSRICLGGLPSLSWKDLSHRSIPSCNRYLILSHNLTLPCPFFGRINRKAMQPDLGLKFESTYPFWLWWVTWYPSGPMWL